MHNSISLQAAVVLISDTFLFTIIYYYASIMEENTATDVGVDTIAGVSYREPQIDPFDSALERGVGGILSDYNIVI